MIAMGARNPNESTGRNAHTKLSTRRNPSPGPRGVRSAAPSTDRRSLEGEIDGGAFSQLICNKRRPGVAPLSWTRWLGGGCCWCVLLLVADGAGVVECRVAALAVVEDLDEIEDRRAQPGSGRPGVAVEQLAFQRGEEALGDGVVQRIPDVPMEATRPEACRRWP